MVFLGGAVLADIIKDNEEVWISRKEYEEQGLKVSWKRCSLHQVGPGCQLSAEADMIELPSATLPLPTQVLSKLGISA